MQAKQLEEAIDNFIADQNDKVLLLRGKWGIGKTYFWKDYLKRKNEKIKECMLSYVSLFGATSISDIEYLILHTATCLDIKRWKKSWRLSGKIYSYMKYLPLMNKYVTGCERMFIKDFLVCMDDFERRNVSKLSIEEVLGFVSVLKEEKDCRIILIFNDDALNPSDKEALDKYKEKIVDIDLLYDPSIAENVGVVIHSDDDKLFYTDIFQSLGVNNIRVIKKCLFNVQKFEGEIKGLELSLQQQVRRNIVALTCFTYLKEYGVNTKYLTDMASFTKAYLSPDTEKMLATNKMYELHRYGFVLAPYNDQLIRYIENKSCDISALSSLLVTANDREKRNNITEQYRSLWQWYQSNFRISESDLVVRFTQFMDKNVEMLSTSEFTEICMFLKDLGVNKGIPEWSKRFINAQLYSMNIAELERWEHEQSDVDILAKIAEQKSKLKQGKTIMSVVKNIVERAGWSEDDRDYLASQKEEDFYQWLKSDESEDLLRCVHQFVLLFRSAGDNGKEKVCADNITNAMKRIAKESIINKRKVEGCLGIKISD